MAPPDCWATAEKHWQWPNVMLDEGPEKARNGSASNPAERIGRIATHSFPKDADDA
jgi:hypothetical protein